MIIWRFTNKNLSWRQCFNCIKRGIDCKVQKIHVDCRQLNFQSSLYHNTIWTTCTQKHFLALYIPRLSKLYFVSFFLPLHKIGQLKKMWYHLYICSVSRAKKIELQLSLWTSNAQCLLSLGKSWFVNCKRLIWALTHLSPYPSEPLPIGEV